MSMSGVTSVSTSGLMSASFGPPIAPSPVSRLAPSGNKRLACGTVPRWVLSQRGQRPGEWRAASRASWVRLATPSFA
jgi:hypothetical protein